MQHLIGRIVPLVANLKSKNTKKNTTLEHVSRTNRDAHILRSSRLAVYQLPVKRTVSRPRWLKGWSWDVLGGEFFVTLEPNSDHD